MFKPSPREVALLILQMAASKGGELGRTVSRFRISESSLLKICVRHRLDAAFLYEVQEWLFSAGWALFFAGNTYALIKARSVEGWTRLASKRIADELNTVKEGKFEFGKIENLLDHADDEETSPADDD